MYDLHVFPHKEARMNPQDVFCPNMACPARGPIGEGNVIGHGRTRRRYRCTVCGKTFSPRTATIGRAANGTACTPVAPTHARSKAVGT